MYTFAFIVCVASCALVQAAPPRIKEIHDECQALHYVSNDVFRAIHAGDSYDRTLVGAHMLCMSTKLGTQNEDGTINKEGLKKALATEITDETKLAEVVDKCAVEQSSPGETAIKLSQCVRENTSMGRPAHRNPYARGHGHHHEHSH